MGNLLTSTLQTALIEGVYIGKELALGSIIYPLLNQLPNGNGRGVFLIPGLANDDRVLWFIKKVLNQKGYHAETWGLGTNRGHIPGMERKLYRSFRAFHYRYGNASIYGHSLGGHIAVALAHHYPQWIDRVITAGGAHNPTDIHPVLPRIYTLLTGKTITESWDEVVKSGHHTTKDVPVFHIIGTQDTLLRSHHTRMEGNPDSHIFPVQTSHGGLLYSWVAMYTLLNLLQVNLGTSQNPTHAV